MRFVESGGCPHPLCIVILYQCFPQCGPETWCGNPVWETCRMKQSSMEWWVVIVLYRNCKCSPVLEIRLLFWDPAHPISIWKIWKLWHLDVIFFYCQVRRESFRNRLEQRTQHILPSPHVNPTTAQYLLRPSLRWVFIKQTPPQVRVTQYISSGSADGTSVQTLSMQCFGFPEMIQGE